MMKNMHEMYIICYTFRKARSYTKGETRWEMMYMAHDTCKSYLLDSKNSPY